MKPYWTDMFYEKLTSCGFKCPVKFKTPYIKKGTRKQACSFFCCYAMCSISICTRKYQIISKQEPEENASVLFLVRITGKENHNINTEISARQLRGKNRILVGKQANEIGPLGVFREHVKNANESLLAAGNYTECETIETLKKAAYDYRKKMHVDEDIFKECRIIARAYLAADVTSTNVKDVGMFCVFNVDKESVLLLTNDKKIFKKAKKKKDELKAVDEYFRSSTAVIHQSPFNEEAIRLYPTLITLINSKSKYDEIINPLFSPAIIRIFYKWWAYLPLWTGLLWHFEERYSNNIETTTQPTYNPIRHSNALIESYFRTMKRSIFKGKTHVRPSDVITDLYRSVQAQFKASKFSVTQSSKGRKRKKKNMNVEEKWGKKTVGQKRRSIYFNIIDKFASKRARLKMAEDQSYSVKKKISETDESATVSSSGEPISTSDIEDNTSLNQSSCSNETNSSSENNSTVSNEASLGVLMCLDKSMTNDVGPSKASSEFIFGTIVDSPLKNSLHHSRNEPNVTNDQLSNDPSSQHSPQPETIIDGYTLRWPKFQIRSTLFQG
ncbi:unnamed protein product [Didymodactylos carnosus]|uniref:Uncharacterized protein n=1 Tax=Didymodactylos carnosus TaxID=1234261 RepID=A0A8S2VL11_9BILA|nr:unnamed protein product [Didymodactylos carnosus]